MPQNTFVAAPQNGSIFFQLYFGELFSGGVAPRNSITFDELLAKTVLSFS